MADSPLGRARQALLEAKQSVALKDNAENRERVELAMAHLDYLLDVLPLTTPIAPEAPGAHTPGASVYDLGGPLPLTYKGESSA